MTKLLAVKPEEVKKQKPKILLFGKSGVGKTWASLDFPSVYYIDTEGGATLPHYTKKLVDSGGVYLGVDQGSLDFKTVINQVKALATQDHEYKTVIIDSISKLYNSEISRESERLGDKDAFGASKKKPIAYMRRLINWLDKIDMNVILIAHEKIEWEGGEASGETFDCWDKLEYELDLCFQIVKTGPKRVARIRKSRLEEFAEKESFPWSYDSFAALYGEEVINKKSEAISLASNEQVEKIKSLIKKASITEKKEQEWFDAAGVTGWDEMPEIRIEKAIKHIESTYLNEKGE